MPHSVAPAPADATSTDDVITEDSSPSNSDPEALPPAAAVAATPQIQSNNASTDDATDGNDHLSEPVLLTPPVPDAQIILAHEESINMDEGNAGSTEKNKKNGGDNKPEVIEHVDDEPIIPSDDWAWLADGEEGDTTNKSNEEPGQATQPRPAMETIDDDDAAPAPDHPEWLLDREGDDTKNAADPRQGTMDTIEDDDTAPADHPEWLADREDADAEKKAAAAPEQVAHPQLRYGAPIPRAATQPHLQPDVTIPAAVTQPQPQPNVAAPLGVTQLQPHPQPHVGAPSSVPNQDMEDNQISSTSESQDNRVQNQTPTLPQIRPNPDLMLSHPVSSNTRTPSLPLLEARLVEDEPTLSVYEATIMRSNRDIEEGQSFSSSSESQTESVAEKSWWERNQRNIVYGMGLVLCVALAVMTTLLATLLVTQGRNDGGSANNNESMSGILRDGTEPTKSPTTLLDTNSTNDTNEGQPDNSTTALDPNNSTAAGGLFDPPSDEQLEEYTNVASPMDVELFNTSPPIKKPTLSPVISKQPTVKPSLHLETMPNITSQSNIVDAKETVHPLLLVLDNIPDGYTLTASVESGIIARVRNITENNLDDSLELLDVTLNGSLFRQRHLSSYAQTPRRLTAITLQFFVSVRVITDIPSGWELLYILSAFQDMSDLELYLKSLDLDTFDTVTISVVTPGQPTKNPTGRPTRHPSNAPTMTPTFRPTGTPTETPTKLPTRPPTNPPTKLPTKKPTESPSKEPTTTKTCFSSNTELKDAVNACASPSTQNQSACDSVKNTYGWPMNNWCTGLITDMSSLFDGKSDFNEDINQWNTTSVTNMEAMFQRALSYDQPLNNWDISSVTSIGYMFFGASSFNQPLNSWDTGQVTRMIGVFSTDFINGETASVFNQPLGNWDTSKVTTMEGMFYGTPFNQDICSWDISNVQTFYATFWESAFDHDCGWSLTGEPLG